MPLEDLEQMGVQPMTDREVRDCLETEGVGVLGLPAEGAPYLVPMSFGFDGESALYFSFLLGPDSRKADLADAASTVSFLVYSASSPYVWQSVRVSGEIEPVPEEAVADLEDVLGNAWRPELFESADLGRGFGIYRLRIDEQVGIKHTGLPPGIAGRDE